MWGEEAWSKWCESVQQLKNVGFDSHQRSMIASWGYQIKYKWIISKNQCQSSSNNFTSKSPAWYRWRWEDKAWFAGLRLLQSSIIDQIFYWLLTKINNIGNEQHSLFWTSAQNWQMEISVSQMILGWYFDPRNISESECLRCHIWISVILE